MPVSVTLLADSPAALGRVAHMRWKEWGYPPEPENLEWWLQTTIQEAGRVDLPVTFVAQHSGSPLGAVGLDTYDLDERHDTSPWVTGMIVRSDRRGEGVGRALMEHLERWAIDHEIGQLWVGTEDAARFYQRCGWLHDETFTSASGRDVTVLYKALS